jgi:hypothetical protein
MDGEDEFGEDADFEDGLFDDANLFNEVSWCQVVGFFGPGCHAWQYEREKRCCAPISLDLCESVTISSL